MPKPTDKHVLQAQLQELTGRNLAATALLYRLAYWMPKAKIVRNGFLWVAKSREDWCSETGLSFDQYKRAVARLRKMGLVSTEKHMFAGKSITFMRMLAPATAVVETVHALNAARKAATKKKAERDQGAAPTGSVHSCTNQIQGVTIQKTFSSASQKSRATPFGVAFNQNCKQEKKAGEVKKDSSEINCTKKTVGELKDKYANKTKPSFSPQKEPPPHSPPSAPAFSPMHGANSKKVNTHTLAHAWKETVSSEFEQYVGVFTGKQMGQFKQILVKCPDGYALPMLITVVKKWYDFAPLVQSLAGLKNSPGYPDVGFVLQHLDFAINFWLEDSKPKQTYQPPPTPAVQVIAPAPKAPAPKKAWADVWKESEDDDDGDAEG